MKKRPVLTGGMFFLLLLTAVGMLDQPGISIAGPAPAQIPYLNGRLCVDPSGLQRLAKPTFAFGGRITEVVDIASSAPGGLNLVAGPSSYYQRWFRYPAAGGGNANFSDGIEIAYTARSRGRHTRSREILAR